MGYAALVEVGGKRILFDTGKTATFLREMRKRKAWILPNSISWSCLIGMATTWAGMSYLLSINPRVKISPPKEGFGVYGGDLPSTFY